MSLRRLFSLIGFLLVASTGTLVWHVWETQRTSHRLATRSLEAVGDLRIAMSASELVWRERAPANAMMGSATPPTAAQTEALVEARRRTDRTMTRLRGVIAALPASPLGRDASFRFDQAGKALQSARNLVDRINQLPPSQRAPGEVATALKEMIAVAPLLTPVITLLTEDAQEGGPDLADALTGARLAGDLREHAGQLGTLVVPPLQRREPFTDDEKDAIAQMRGRTQALCALLDQRIRLPDSPAGIVSAYARMQQRYAGDANRLLADVIAAGHRNGQFNIDATEFTGLYIPMMDSIVELRDAMLSSALSSAQARRDRATSTLAFVFTGAAVLVLVLLLAIRLMYTRVLDPLSRTTGALKALALGNVEAALPKPVAKDEIADVVHAVRALRQYSVERIALEAQRDELIARLQQQSRTDFLTGLPNRRAFLAAAERDMAQANRQGFDIAAIVIDIDNFKRVNDNHGHAAGDQILIAVATTIKQLLRGSDLIARFGGEEFAILLSHCNASSGGLFAERVRQSIDGTRIEIAGHRTIRVTASFGVSDLRLAGGDLTQMLQRADKAMYLAKNNGRNRVVVDMATTIEPVGGIMGPASAPSENASVFADMGVGANGR